MGRIKALKQRDSKALLEREEGNKAAANALRKPPIRKAFEELGGQKGEIAIGMIGMDLKGAGEERPLAPDTDEITMARAVLKKYLPKFSRLQNKAGALNKIKFIDGETLLQICGEGINRIPELYAVIQDETQKDASGIKVVPEYDEAFLALIERNYVEISP